MKNKILIPALIFAASLILVPQFITAQEATTSAEEIQEDLKQRIKESVDQNIDNAQTLGEQASLRAFVGLIESISESTISITVNPNHGSATVIKQATVSPDTTLIRVGQTETDLEDFEIGDYIIAMGSPENETSLKALRIVVDDYTPPASIRRLAYAKIQEIQADSLSFTNHSPYLENALDLTSQTQLSTVDQKDLSLEDLSSNQPVALILSVDNDDPSDVSLLRLLAFPLSPDQSDNQNSATQSGQAGYCGDGICQDVVCQGLGCPEPETPETCPADCTQD